MSILNHQPIASALAPTIAAVTDTFAHVPEGAVVSVPVGTPHENFDLVEWCAVNGKQIINRFDAWPLPALLVENTRVRELVNA